MKYNRKQHHQNRIIQRKHCEADGELFGNTHKKGKKK